MAKLKEKIHELKTKYGITEEAAREVLALHDGDLAEANSMITDAQNKVIGWNQFWYEKAPQIQALAEENERLKAQVETVKTAFNPANPNPNPNPNPSTNTQPQSLEELEKRIYNNFSAVQEDIYNIQRQHLENYKTLPDLGPIKKLIDEKGMTPWKAYEEWVRPLDEKRKEDALREKITQELTTKFQNENTRTGLNSFMLTNKSSLTGEEVTSPLDESIRARGEEAAVEAAKAAQAPTAKTGDPSDFELMVDFTNSMREGRNRLAH